MKTIARNKTLLTLGVALTLLAGTAQAQWLPTYQFRKPLAINAGSGTGTSYQVQVRVGESSGASGFDMQVEGHALNFPNDVRFTDDDGGTELGHWLETTTGTAPNRTATFWVKVNDSLDSAQSVLAYYGKSAGATGSNGTATFSFFDDFTGAAIDTGKWTIDNATGWSVTGGELRGTNTSGRIRSQTTFSSGVILETKYRSVTRATNGNTALGFYISSSDCFGWLNHPNPDYIRENTAWTSIGAECNVPVIARMTTRATQVDFTVNRQDNGAVWHNQANRTNTVANEPIALGARYDNILPNQTYDAYWDWVRVRKSATTIPALGAAGAEQTDGLGVNVTAPANGQAIMGGTTISATAVVFSGTAPYSVEFFTSFNGGAATSAGTVNVSPYTISLGTLAAGNYTIYAVVTDSAGPVATDTSGINTFTVDGTPPTLAANNIVDNANGGPVQEDVSLVTYTVTFSEDMDAGTVSAADFGNGGSSTFSIGTVAETSPGVFTVPVTPTSAGTLQLRINAAADLRDTAGNALNTTSAILDDTIITVTSDTTAPNPNPMTWATAPRRSTTNNNAITMTATTATDPSGVEYFFECTAGGGDSSAWQDSPTYTDTGLPANATCTYRVRARDKSPAQTATGFSPAVTASTPITASVSASATAPAINNQDIANYGVATASPDKWFVGSDASSTAKGQTFRTGPYPGSLKALTYQTLGSAATKTYIIRVGTVSGSTFGELKVAAATQAFNYNSNDYVTWTFANPVALAPNTNYAVDVAMTGSTSAWQTGIPYISHTAGAYANGAMYNSGISGQGDSNISTTSNDRIFHLDLEHPMKPNPDFGATVLAGNISLSWTNLAPTTGTDVWVDVWFGTNPAALTQVVTAGLNTTSTTVTVPGAGTYYWRVDSYLNGSPTGSPLTGDLFNFIVTDSDGDGLPDSFEFANTTPPSYISMLPGDDNEPDGSTNLQEYLAGTNPNNPDTDADGFQDGHETNTGIWVSLTNTGTKPLLLDTDGDTIRDGYEKNTGTFNSTTDTGTNPNKADSDSDALNDNLETGTGVLVSKTDTGTNPNVSDTDNDGAGDWYEVTASFTSPFLAVEKPKVPYPLPDPDASTGNPSKKVKVYIMSGQSNMVGMGLVGGTDEKSLESMTLRQNKFPNLVNASGAWTTRQDVQYRGVVTDVTNAKLSAGSLGAKFGPELGFGQIMGYYHDAPVLLIKSSDGNRALSWDVLPHGTPSWVYGTTNYAGYGDYGNWPVGGTAPTSGGWYAGKEFDRFFKHESEWAHPDTANTNVVDVLDNFATQYPDWAAQGFEIAGFVWWQGEKDGSDMGWATQYEPNLVRLINSLRTYYSNRYPGNVMPNAPFVLATLGEAALTNTSPATEVAVRNAHFAVDSATGNNPQTNVKTVYSYPLSEGGTGNGHYGDRAGTYMLVGDALGRAMIDLQPATAGDTYANWIATFPGAASMPGFDQDADGDGIDNGAENFFGTNPGVGSSGLVSGASSGNTFTFTHPQNATPATGVTGIYRWSKDLTSFRNGGQADGDGTTVSFNAVTNAGITTVTATVTGTATTKLFVDVKVTQN